MNHTLIGDGKGSPVVEFPEQKTIQVQAAEWMAKLDGGEPSQEDLLAFKQWINADPAHKQAFEEMVAFWGDMNVLTQIVTPREEERMKKARLFTSIGWGGAVAAMLLVVVTVWFVPQFQQTESLIYMTKVGEQKTVELPDHTTVFLNTNSQIEVDYSDERRGVKLIQGEAHFDVFHQPSRPFEVYAGNGLVRAVGTAFTVHIKKVNVEVVVTEGIVEIDSLPEKANPNQKEPKGNALSVELNIEVADEYAKENKVRVKAGSMATFGRKQVEQVQQLVEKEIEEKLSWRQGLLVFNGEPLEQVVDEVSRYTDIKIIIPERQSREMKVGGIFKVGDTESMFEALREGFDLHAQYVSDDLVYLISEKNR